MNPKTKLEMINNARTYLNQGWHCSEGILKAVGGYYFPEQLPEVLKLAAPFSGGVGGTKQSLCGALTGGLMAIGMLYGRMDAGQNDDHCVSLAAEFQANFITHFAYKRCSDLRENWVGRPGQPDCAELTSQATAVLIDLLEK